LFSDPIILALRLTIVLLLFSRTCPAASSSNLVANGAFESAEGNSQIPDYWSVAGNRAINQTLQLDIGPDGSRCARLDCTAFTGSGGDYHAMICQMGQVQVSKSRWYRLRFQAKAAGLKGGVAVALINRRPWSNAGLDEVFVPDGRWKRYEFLFQAQADLPATASRLQFWFTSTGTLWLDDVELIETNERPQWFPQVSSEGVKNFLPNSSFECGNANWGSITYGLKGWAGNLFRLEGELAKGGAPHGDTAFKIPSDAPPTFYFDYYEPIQQPVKHILLANRGWLQVKPGEPLTFSAYVRASTNDVKVGMVINEAPDHLQQKTISAGVEWRRYEFTFIPTSSAVFVAIGPDFGGQGPAAAVWLDALQLERGNHATDYEPRQPVESFLEAQTNIFPDTNISFAISGCNNTASARVIQGHLTTTDFFDRIVSETNESFEIPAHSSQSLPVKGLSLTGQGFFRTTWTTTDSTQSVRYVVASALTRRADDCPFGMNHAYPWDFLIRSAREVGVVWWRDWSAKWDTIEPKKGHFDFSAVDPQIERVIVQGGKIDALLPFPASSWSTSGSDREIEKIADGDSGAKNRLRLACPPRDVGDFGNYARHVAEHYRGALPVSDFELLNEPLYTDYALPRQLGYTLADYVRLVQAAAPALRAANPDCRVIGGIGAGPDAELTRRFVTDGGIKAVDILDLHMYDPAISPENFESAFKSLEDLMRQHGAVKPIWITEWGCYADDDPACLPLSVGDATMNHCLWPSELAATENLVKFSAISFAHGVRRIFFHAGVCGMINGPDTGSVFFEYGGAPRKMYAGAAAFTRIIGVPEKCSKIVNTNGMHAYIFDSSGESVAIAWCSGTRKLNLKLPDLVLAFDIMGNSTNSREITIQQSPIYLKARSAGAIAQLFARSPHP
jgi:hypothetical protein